METTTTTSTTPTTFLQHIGQFLGTLLSILTTVTNIAKDVEPVINVDFPQIAPLYDLVVGLAIAAEATAAQVAGSGPVKLQKVSVDLVPKATAWAKANNINWPEPDIIKWASNVVDTMNIIPGPTN
jgi:hypothetical protein